MGIAILKVGTHTNGSVVCPFSRKVSQQEAQLPQRDRATRAMLVNLRYVLRTMGVIKVSNNNSYLQGRWQWCYSIDHIRFAISVTLQICLCIAPLTRYYHCADPEIWLVHTKI